jgi:hypothetical protein
MGYTVDARDADDIIICTSQPPLDAVVDPRAVAKEARDFYQRTQRTVYAISDVSLIDLSFSDLIVRLGAALRTPEARAAQDTPLIGYVVIPKLNPVIKSILTSLESGFYSKTKFYHVYTVDEALALIAKHKVEVAPPPASPPPQAV